MRVLVQHRLVAVHVAVRFLRRPFMFMLMMHIVHMAVLVLEFIVNMFMLVSFGKMEPQANCHENAGSDQPQCHCIAEHEDRKRRADEGRHREICTCPGRSEVAKPQHKENDADPDTKQPDDGSRHRQRGRDCWRAEVNGQPGVHRTGHQTLHRCDLNGVGSRELARQFVVDAPGEAGTGNQDAAPAETESQRR